MAEERRVVTVLFADVAGSTQLGESTDPEEVRALLARYYGVAREIVAAHDGTVEKFIGDAVMAVFGMPLAHGDDAERALSAALELRDRVRGDSRLGERTPLRIGVNTGEVVAAREAAGDFLITGDPVNTAARLQQAADAWQILCGERTVRAASDGYVFGPIATIEAKGKRGGIAAAPLTARSAKSRTRLPLIGRDADLEQLELVARRVATEKRPALVSIVAPAGTGKTRLLEEFLDRLPSLIPRAKVAIAQCLPYGQRLTYWPLRAMLFRLVGLADDAANDVARASIREWLGAHGVLDADRVTQLLAATIGVGTQETTDRAALLGAWRIALDAAAAHDPLVLVFEDLHWSSDSLLELVEFVMRPRADVRTLTIALARPELLDRRPAWGGGQRSFVSIALEPLPEGAISRIVTDLLATSSAEISARVVARAEGNPFYATELVRALRDRMGRLPDPDAVEAALASLPDTVQGTVLARLDLLAPVERRILQLGAVLGRTFRPRGIEALAPELTGRVEEGVETLIAKELVRPTASDAVTFRHILIREVAYQTLPRSERATLHAAAARWLEGFAAGREDAFVELIAYHWREAAALALAASTSEVADFRAKASVWLVRAADVAAASGAHPEAARHLRAAMEVADPALHVDIYERLGAVLQSGDESAAAYRTARDLLRASGRPDPSRELALLAGELEVFTRWQGSVTERATPEHLGMLVEEGLKILPAVSDERAISRFLSARALVPYAQSFTRRPTESEIATGEESARRALVMAEGLGDLPLQSMALDALGGILGLRREPAAILDLARRRLAMGEGIDLVERLDAAAVATWTAVDLGELDQALTVSYETLRQLLPGQAPATAVNLVSWRGMALFLTGSLEKAVEAGEFDIQLHSEAGIENGPGDRGLEAACAAARALGDGQRAERFREQALRRFRRGDIQWEFTRMLYEASPGRELVDAILHGLEIISPVRLHRGLSRAADLRLPGADVLERVDRAGLDRYPLVLAAARRITGLERGRADLLISAKTLYERCGAAPSAARARVEAAMLSGDGPELSAALGALRTLGDLEQVERYESGGG